MEKLSRGPPAALALAAAAALGLAACRAHAPAAGAAAVNASDGLTRVVCAGEAGDEVRLAGSFDGWRAGQALTAGADGRLAADLALPPGPSAVACVRRAPDGGLTSSAPLNAPAVEPDGFGGENGLFEGPPAAAVTSNE